MSRAQSMLQRYASEKISSLSRYIKVAVALPNKSVRDVALRVRWMGRKDTPRKQRSKVRRGCGCGCGMAWQRFAAADARPARRCRRRSR